MKHDKNNVSKTNLSSDKNQESNIDENIKKINDYKKEIKMLNEIRKSEKEKNNNEIKALKNKIKQLEKVNDEIKIKINEIQKTNHRYNDERYKYNNSQRHSRGYSYDKYERPKFYTPYIITLPRPPPPTFYNYFPYQTSYIGRDIFQEMGVELLAQNIKNNLSQMLFGANNFNSGYQYNNYFMNSPYYP